jgi:hypothetical protein
LLLVPDVIQADVVKEPDLPRDAAILYRFSSAQAQLCWEVGDRSERRTFDQR